MSSYASSFLEIKNKINPMDIAINSESMNGYRFSEYTYATPRQINNEVLRMNRFILSTLAINLKFKILFILNTMSFFV